MKPGQIKVNCVYDYLPPKAKGPYPCVWVDEIADGIVFFRWLEEDGGHGEKPVAAFARRCTSRRHARTWNRIAP